jgi:hypothetical protein
MLPPNPEMPHHSCQSYTDTTTPVSPPTTGASHWRIAGMNGIESTNKTNTLRILHIPKKNAWSSKFKWPGWGAVSFNGSHTLWVINT